MGNGIEMGVDKGETRIAQGHYCNRLTLIGRSVKGWISYRNRTVLFVGGYCRSGMQQDMVTVTMRVEWEKWTGITGVNK